MKESGIEWLDSIPKNWDTLRIKNVVTNIVNGNWGQDEQSDSDDISVIRVADFNRSNSKVNNVEFTIRNIKNIYEKDEQLINPKQDLLIEKSGGGDKTPVGQVVHYAESKPATFTNFISKLTINTSLMNLSFMNYYFSALYSNGISWKHIKQTTGIQNLDVKSYLNEKMPVPKLEIQNKITYFLDEKTSEIDNIVEKTKQSIEELKAYKQSLITETVTKGLDPDTPMKDSGIEWIGEIPYIWDTTTIKRIFQVVSGGTPKTNITPYWDGDIPWITPADYNTEMHYISKGSRNISEKGLENSSANLIPSNSIILSKRAPIGKVIINTTEIATNQGCLASIPKTDNTVNIEYIYYLLSIFTEQLNMLGSGTTFKELSLERYKSFWIPLPPMQEQNQISEYLIKRTKEIDKLINKKDNMIKQLESYKQSLIYEYVTGKKEVK